MNSWHTFSPNGRWLAFSSKARSPYTQLMLTHIDANGNDSPAIMVDNITAANRAVNIPEFVNIPPDGLQHIDPEATEFYRLFNLAFEQMEKKATANAIATFHTGVKRDPERSHRALRAGHRLDTEQPGATCGGRISQGLHVQHQSSHCVVRPSGGVCRRTPAIPKRQWRAGLRLWLSTRRCRSRNGPGRCALTSKVSRWKEREHLRKAVKLAPIFADAHYRLGFELAKTGRTEEALENFIRL